MKKKTFDTVTRVMAVVASLLIMVGAASYLGQGSAGVTMDDIYAQTSGIDSDAVVMTVDGVDVTAQEYLYYVLNYGYQYYSYYTAVGMAVDWEMPVDEAGTMTLADYVLAQAQDSVVQDAVLCRMAVDNGITVTQENLDEFYNMVASIQELYGENIDYELMARGLTMALLEKRNDNNCLAVNLQEAYLNGALRPNEAALAELVNEHGLTMARSILVSTAYLEDDGIEQAKATAEEYLERITAAEDMSAEVAAINTELGVSDEENVAALYHCGHDHGDGEDDIICETLEALQVGELSRIVETEEGFYLLLREETDMDTVAQVKFSEDVEAAISGAEIVFHTENLERLDVGTFIESYINALTVAAEQLAD